VAEGDFSVEDIEKGIAHAESTGDSASLAGLRARHSALIAAAIVDTLDTAQLTFITEDDLQAAIATALAEAGLHPQREVILDRANRIDLTVDHVGIEVKIDGTWANVIRQLTRYAHHPDIDHLILVTTRTRHHKIPTALAGVPVHLVSLIGAAL
jgi:hypothetical protein